MKFAINYSPQAVQLLNDGKIDLDLFKCPDWTDLVATASETRPVYIHFPLIIGRGRSVDFDAIEAWLAKTDTRFVNAHLLPNATTFPDGVDAPLDAVIDRVLTETRTFVERFGADRVILENVPYPDVTTHDLLRHAVDPVLMNTVVEETGCGLLLDTAHATLACEGIGANVRDYIDSLPVHKLRELHITGVDDTDDGTRLDHLAMTEADWALAEWAFGRIRAGAWRAPEIVAFEYGGIGEMFEWRSDINVIAANTPRLYALVHREPNPEQPPGL